MSLAEIQGAVRRFVVGDDPGARLAVSLIGGTDPLRRLGIHRRHYRASLVSALEAKYPATAWLVGARRLQAAAESYVQVAPPSRPCIAEYGEEFPAFLAALLGDQLHYLESFATLEWHVGHVAVAIDHPPVAPAAWLAEGEDVDVRSVSLQPGVRLLASDWPVDRLFDVFLGEVKPTEFEMAPERVGLELRGARGTFTLRRLSPGRFAFRAALRAGHTLAAASDDALRAEPTVDLPAEVAALFTDRLVVDSGPRVRRGPLTLVETR
ncbi:MAG: putative DNA-binding domain-containing protein [Microbacteriaceae bacterium]